MDAARATRRGLTRKEPVFERHELVGQRKLTATANTYTHVLSDEQELDYGALLH